MTLREHQIRLSLRAGILDALERRRFAAKDSGIGARVEKSILDSELGDIEAATRLVEIRERAR